LFDVVVDVDRSNEDPCNNFTRARLLRADEDDDGRLRWEVGRSAKPHGLIDTALLKFWFCTSNFKKVHLRRAWRMTYVVCDVVQVAHDP
jgi:hypothetical protein